MKRVVVAFFGASFILAVAGCAAARSEELPELKEGPQVGEDYCSSFAEAAAETRFMLQQERLKNLKADIEERLSELRSEAKRLQDFVDARQALRKQVGERLTKIYANMEPDAAVKVIKQLNPAVAAEILVSLNPKQAGSILALMEPRDSSRIVTLMAALAYARTGKKS
jgi:flagellar motility protein MotE (MotC chaperone)